MTPRELIEATRARGISLRVDAGRIYARHLLAAERDYLRDPRHARAVAALLALDAVLARQAEQNDREQRELWEALQARHRARQRRNNMDVMAEWDETKVRRLAAAGKLTAQDVEDWVEARRERDRRLYLRVFGAAVAGLTGRTVRITW